MSDPAKALVKLEPGFNKKAVAIALPVVIDHLISVSLNMVDTMMIGKLGVNPLAAVGVANRVFFVFIILCFGFFSGASVHLAQHWGAGNIGKIRRIMGVNYVFCGSLSLLVMIVSYFFAPEIISLFVKDAIVIDYGANYLRIVQISYIFTAISFAIAYSSRAIHRLLIPTAISAAALATNTFLNYCLIYGNFGFPRLEVEGAAIATVIARVAQMLGMLLYVYRSKDHPLGGRIKQMFSYDRELTRNILKTARPTVISEGTWSLGNSVYYIAYGKISEAAIAVVQVSAIVNELFMAVFFGLGSACAVMIGNELGRGEKVRAYAYSKLFLKITFGLCLVMTLGFWLSKNPVIRFYDFDAVTSLLLSQTLIVYIIFTTPRMLTYTMFIGILRAGGDARFTMILDVLGIWCVGVPLAFFGVLVLHWSLPAVIALSLIDVVIKMFFCFHRMRSKKWMNVLV